MSEYRLGVCGGGLGSLGSTSVRSLGWCLEENHCKPGSHAKRDHILALPWAEWLAKETCLSGDQIFISGGLNFISSLLFSS